MKTLRTTTSKLVLIAGLISASALVSMGVDVFAQDQAQAQVQIYGSQLMTPAERTEYQTKMRALKTDKERDAFRLDHHDKMKVRAAEKGVTLPNSPPAAGTGPQLLQRQLQRWRCAWCPPAPHSSHWVQRPALGGALP